MWSLVVIVCLITADGSPDYRSCERAVKPGTFSERFYCQALAHDRGYRLAVQRLAFEWLVAKGGQAVRPRIECMEAREEA